MIPSCNEQAQLRETSINEIGLALARIEDKLKNGITRLIKLDEKCDGLSAKLDTLSGQQNDIQAQLVALRKLQTLEHNEVLRRIDKLGNDMFAALAVLKLRKNKHKRKKGKK